MSLASALHLHNVAIELKVASPGECIIWKSFTRGEGGLKEIMNKSGWYKIIICGDSAEEDVSIFKRLTLANSVARSLQICYEK